MKKKDKQKILRNISWPNGFAHTLHNEAAYELIGNDYPLMKGFLVGSSGVKHKFYLHSFVIPLYVYFDAYNLSYGKRVADRDGATLWDSTNLDYEQLNVGIHEEYNSFVGIISSLDDFFRWMKNRMTNATSAQYFDIIYTCIALNKLTEACQYLNTQIKTLSKLNGDWVARELRAANQLLETLKSGDIDQVRTAMSDNVNRMKKIFCGE